MSSCLSKEDLRMARRESVPSTRFTSLTWALWVVVSVMPLLAYASPLWNNLLADTPIADLVWIPVIALSWAAWNIVSRSTSSTDDDELNLILGGLLAALTGLALVLAPSRWPTTFVHNHAGLLLWPFWILAMTWLIWGLSFTRRISGPLLYLLLVWPPIFAGLANSTQTILVTWAVSILTLFSHMIPWITPVKPTGTFAVLYQHHPFLVVVAQACSGADSLLGSAIIIPVIWFLFKGSFKSKLAISVIALVGALVLNWMRLAIIVVAVHFIGPHFTFAYIHPALGFVLFAFLVTSLMFLFRPFGLEIPANRSSHRLKLPGWGRIGSAVIMSSTAFALLWPLFSLPQGSFGNPSKVTAYNVHTFLPSLASFSKTPVYYANESSVLGMGSATQADTYTQKTGKQALVEMWSTPNATALATYGFHSCLLYHGDALAAVQSFQLLPGVVATAYAVELPPNHVGGRRSTYVDVEWNNAILYKGHIHYMRWSIASFPQSIPVVPTSVAISRRVLPLSPVQAMVTPQSSGHWTAATAATRQTLITLAQTVFSRSIAPTHA